MKQVYIFGLKSFSHLLSMNKIMKKQKCSPEKGSQCQLDKDDKEELYKIKTLLLEQMDPDRDVTSFSPFKLLKIYVASSVDRTKFIAQIDSLLRSFLRQEPTIEYNESTDVLGMVDNIIFKMRKERDIHRSVLEKQHQILTRYTSEQTSAYEQIDYLKELLNEQQKQVQVWKKETDRREKDRQSLKRQIQSRKAEINDLRETNQKLQAKIANLQANIANLQAKSSNLQLKCANLDKDKVDLSKTFLQKSQQVAKLAQHFNNFKEDLIYKHKLQLAEQIQTMRKQLAADNPQLTRPSNKRGKNGLDFDKNLLFNHLFVGDVLFNEDEQRYFLVDLLQSHERNAIHQTKLLYRWDPLNNTNFHRYIDGFQNILLLVRTTNDCLIGAYSESAFKPKTISNLRGLLISFAGHLCFKNVKKAIIYDENDIIFGNEELKIKHGENKVHSNFAANGAFYQSQGETVHTLLGEGKNRVAKIKTYEIFQVIFQT